MLIVKLKEKEKNKTRQADCIQRKIVQSSK